jgi:hypothetical protein
MRDGRPLAERQAELVAALTGTGAVPDGFDARLVGAARAALLRKRAGEVARHWPRLAAGHGTAWPATFVAWAAGRPTAGALRDGWDLARGLAAAGTLPPVAAEELAARETTWRYDGTAGPRRRRFPALRRTAGVVTLTALGRTYVLHRSAPGAGSGRTRRDRPA